MTSFTLCQERGGVPGGPSFRGGAPEPHGGAAARCAEGPDRARRRALVLVPALLLLGGCGQKGALFLPEENEEGEEARATPAPVSVA